MPKDFCIRSGSQNYLSLHADSYLHGKWRLLAKENWHGTISKQHNSSTLSFYCRAKTCRVLKSENMIKNRKVREGRNKEKKVRVIKVEYFDIDFQGAKFQLHFPKCCEMTIIVHFEMNVNWNKNVLWRVSIWGFGSKHLGLYLFPVCCWHICMIELLFWVNIQRYTEPNFSKKNSKVKWKRQLRWNFSSRKNVCHKKSGNYLKNDFSWGCEEML